MILASVLFTVMIGLVKVARQEMAAFEIIFWRAALSAPLAALAVRGRGFAITNRSALLWRCLLGFGAMTCFYTAARGLTVSDLSILGKLQPLFVALIAPLALGATERARPLVWLALAVGVTGSALIIGPQLQMGSLYGLWALAAAVLSAAAHVSIRRLGQSDSPYPLVFWFQAVTLVLAAPACAVAVGTWVPLPPQHLWPHLVGCAVASTAGQWLMTHAYACDRAPLIAAASYTGPLFGVLADLLVFGAMPGAPVWIGGSLVVAAGLALVFRGQGPGPSADRADIGATGGVEVQKH
jgi:drug/metabolite transporter (DMT)-like permease